MTLDVVKVKLHDYIEHADGKKLKELYTLVEKDMEPDYELSEADMKELDDRWDEYLSGKMKTLTLEEAKESLNKYIEQKRKSAI